MFNKRQLRETFKVIMEYSNTKAAGTETKTKRLRDNKFLLNAYQVYKYIFFFPMLGLSTLLLTIFGSLITVLFGERKAQICGKVWSRVNSYLTPMFVTVTGKEHIDKKQSYVIAANHKSQYDIFAIYGWLPADFRWVMKMELRKVPLLGYVAEKGGHICIDRSDPQKAAATLNAAKSKIKDGTSVFFFPEGTRGPADKLLPFKKGAFRMAIDMQLPVLPVTIIGTDNLLPTNSITLFPGKAKIIVHKPIDVAGLTTETLLEKTKAVIESGFTEV